MPEEKHHPPTSDPIASPEGLVPGQAFGQYTLVEEVGHGGMGVVWKAHHPVLHRDDALKFLSPQLARSDEARERFIREGRSASALKHSGIATVYSAGETDGKVYIAQEFIDGTTVSELVKDGPLAAAEAFRIAIMAGRAIGYAHEHNVLHRDVTSRNVMITRDGNVVVVDFGLAVVQGATRFTQSGAVVGTLPYMAPELLTGGKASTATDVYSLGVVLYEMLVGTAPFHGEFSAALMWAIANQEPESISKAVPGLPPEIDRIAAKMLAKTPNARYKTAEELVAELESLLQTGVLPDVPPEKALVRPPKSAPSMPPRQRPRRRRTIGIIAGVALLAFVAIRWGPRLLPSNAEPAFASVAVLPFEVDGSTADLPDWMLSGVAEELTAKIAKLGDCRVVTWTSSRRFSAKDMAVPDIAKELGVEAIVRVSVRSAGEKLMGSVSLVDGTSGQVTWNDEFEQARQDLFGIERELAVSVTEGLFSRVTNEADRMLSVPASHNADAYEHYLKGANALQEDTPEANNRALAFFERALELDPQLDDAYVGLGAVYGRRYFFGWEEGQSGRDLSEKNFRKAWEMDPSNLDALRGLIRAVSEQGHLEESLRLGVQIPIGRDATVDQLMTRAGAYMESGFRLEAVPLFERAIAIEPSNQGAHFWLLLALVWGGEYARAIEQGETYFSKFGEDPEVHLWVAVAHENLGNVEEAAVHFRRALELFGDFSEGYVVGMAANFFMKTGRVDQANKILATGIERMERSLAANPGNGRVMIPLAWAYIIKGDKERFLEIAKQYRSLDATYAPGRLVLGYFRFGAEDEGAEYLCELVSKRHLACPDTENVTAEIRNHPRAQACLDELQRQCEEMNDLFRRSVSS
jgi:serine/threonine protein kinase/tetratricopeptide (TPR) repeat protein